MTHETNETRAAVLRAAGAEGEILEALLRYDEPVVLKESFRLAELPLPDEPHIGAWDEYASDASRLGAIEALRQRLVQLRFPVAEGISRSDDYLAATRRGVVPLMAAPPSFAGRITLTVEETIAGKVPILVASDRGDFETLVQVFGSRNEPEPVPASMGACIVTGLNDWDRVRVYREAWTAAHDESGWPDEFSRFSAMKELYQDRFIILSSGSYSGVPVPDGFSPDGWLETSLRIRREHESTHYLTYRLTGSMRNHLLDELIADYAALVRTFSEYRPRLAMLFFGLESFPDYRRGGRMENYRGKPPLPDEALPAVANVLHAAILGLAAFDEIRRRDHPGPVQLARFVALLALRTLTDLASPDFVERFLSPAPETVGAA